MSAVNHNSSTNSLAAVIQRSPVIGSPEVSAHYDFQSFDTTAHDLFVPGNRGDVSDEEEILPTASKVLVGEFPLSTVNDYQQDDLAETWALSPADRIGAENIERIRKYLEYLRDKTNKPRDCFAHYSLTRSIRPFEGKRAFQNASCIIDSHKYPGSEYVLADAVLSELSKPGTEILAASDVVLGGECPTTDYVISAEYHDWMLEMHGTNSTENLENSRNEYNRGLMLAIDSMTTVYSSERFEKVKTDMRRPQGSCQVGWKLWSRLGPAAHFMMFQGRRVHESSLLQNLIQVPRTALLAVGQDFTALRNYSVAPSYVLPHFSHGRRQWSTAGDGHWLAATATTAADNRPSEQAAATIVAAHNHEFRDKRKCLRPSPSRTASPHHVNPLRNLDLTKPPGGIRPGILKKFAPAPLKAPLVDSRQPRLGGKPRYYFDQAQPATRNRVVQEEEAAGFQLVGQRTSSNRAADLTHHHTQQRQQRQQQAFNWSGHFSVPAGEETDTTDYDGDDKDDDGSRQAGTSKQAAAECRDARAEPAAGPGTMSYQTPNSHSPSMNGERTPSLSRKTSPGKNSYWSTMRGTSRAAPLRPHTPATSRNLARGYIDSLSRDIITMDPLIRNGPEKIIGAPTTATKRKAPSTTSPMPGAFPEGGSGSGSSMGGHGNERGMVARATPPKPPFRSPFVKIPKGSRGGVVSSTRRADEEFELEMSLFQDADSRPSSSSEKRQLTEEERREEILKVLDQEDPFGLFESLETPNSGSATSLPPPAGAKGRKNRRRGGGSTRAESSYSPSSSESSAAASSRSASPAAGKFVNETDIEPHFCKLKISEQKDTELALERQLALEIEEDARRKERERVRREAEEERLRLEAEEAERRRIEEEEIAARTGGLRPPKSLVVGGIARDWQERIMNTLNMRDGAAIGKSGEGGEVTARDFKTVVPPTVWLNDEIINGSLAHLAKFINSRAGITDVKKQTAKCVLLNSHFYSSLVSKGPGNTARWLRRLGIRPDNFLEVETFIIPINLGNQHWTLGVVRPGRGDVAHIDSIRPDGAGRDSIAAKLMEWVRTFLGDKFDEKHWKTRNYVSPEQTNGHDCGVHSITTAMCIALGIDPASYDASDMPLQRLRIAGVLLNDGFHGEFDLSHL